MWKEKARDLFPELSSDADEAETPYLLWFALRDAFFGAYRSPRNESLIRRIYEFADWCVKQPGGQTAEDDLATCVSVSFYEHIPEMPEARSDMTRWFTNEEFQRMQEIFRYHLDEKE